MTDVVNAAARSRMMSGIRGKNTLPEILVRKALFRAGFRYILHDRKLPGVPDLVFPKHRAVVLIHGCFWHRHQCHLFKWPSSRIEFWRTKLNRNARNDKRTYKRLRQDGWRILTLWECAIKGKKRKNLANIVNTIAKWLLSKSKERVILG